MIRVSCIIPAYNEQARIANVLKIVSGHPLIDEIIVVDDGSKDGTVNMVKQFPNTTLIVQSVNGGKSKAIYIGFKQAHGEFILFLDSDLVGLTPQNITDLISPVTENKADVSISLRKNAPKTWHRIGIDYISGERVFPKALLEHHIEKILTLPPFGLESFFNIWIIKNKCRVKIVPWLNVESPFKYKKYGWRKGIVSDVKMMLDIFRTISLWGPIYQIIKLRKLRVDCIKN